MGSFKTITDSDISTTTSTLNQLVDVIQEDVSGSSTRKRYQVFVTGGIGPGVTSSLFQTVFDQDHSLQTANAVLDMTVGLWSGSDTVQNTKSGVDANGKDLFPSQSMMMREKVDIYRQAAQLLLGHASGSFFAPGVNVFDSTISAVRPAGTSGETGPHGDRINEALFINFRRLFARDEIKKETFAMRLFATGVLSGAPGDPASEGGTLGDASYATGSNLTKGSISGSMILADVGSSTTQLKYFGGDVGYIKNTANTNEYVGLMWYDHGIAVLDMGKIFMNDQYMSGAVGGMANNTAGGAAAGKVILGSPDRGNPTAKFIPDLLVSASIDDIVDHVATCRFGSGSQTFSTFQNVTNINSTLFFCRASADEMNYSSNPTFTNSDGVIEVVDSTDTSSRTFSFVTSVGLYNANNDLLAVAKLSRPVEKNDERDLSIRVRLDF